MKKLGSNNKRFYQLRQDYLRLFFRKKKRATALHVLKNIEDVEALRDVQNCVRSFVPGLNNEIEGCLFPSTFEQLCSTLVTFVRPISLNSELVWFSSYLINYREQMRWFLERKEEFEQQFMAGEFAKAYDTLQSVRDTLGVSLWYYESMFLLYEYWDKRSDGIVLMSSCLENTKDADVNHLQSLLYVLHQRCTTNISPYKFDEDLDALYKQNRTLLHEDYYRYVLFRLNMYNNIDQEELSYNMMFESLSALVDRYLMSVNVLKATAVSGKLDKDLLSRANYLYSKTADKDLLPLLASDGRKMKMSYYNATFIAILDSYYSGDYQRTLDLCREFVKTDTCQFDVMVIYCRSLVYMGFAFQNIIPLQAAPINRLCRRIYRVLTEKDTRETVYQLYQMNKNLYGFHLAASMHFFVKKELNEPVNEAFRAYWNCCFDPDYATMVFSDTDDAANYIASYPDYRNSVSCKVVLAKLDGKELKANDVSYNILVPHNATIKMKNEECEVAYQLWKEFYKTSHNWLPNRQKAVRNMVDCLHKSGKTGKAITLYVDYLLSDQASTQKVDTDSIIKFLQDNLYEGIRRDIDLAIFMGLNCKDGVDKSFILLEFCETKEVELPSELIGNLDEPLNRQEVFFAILNDDETLRHYFNIPSLKDRLNERLKIINYLISLDTSNKESYQQMQKEIEDALLVYRVSKNLNEGKIYANDQAILKYKLNEVDGLYNRFVRLFQMVVKEHRRIYVINWADTTVLLTNDGYEGEKVKSKSSISTGGIYEVFYSLYDYVLDKFLNSEFGLIAYLSTRVRHGELESKLRPELAQRNLILSMKDNVYQETSFWRENYNLSPAENMVVNNALAKFSESFDKEVYELIKERLQIYDREKMPKGLFNYDATESELAYKAMEIGEMTKDAGKEEFCRQIINWLWQKTEVSLTEIRRYISGEFTERINGLFETLKSDLSHEALPTGHIHAFLQAAIAEASTVIASRLKTIECWFNITGTKLEDVDMRQLVHQVYNNIATTYQQIQVTGKPRIEGESFKIKSTYVLHFADLLRNLISNMFKHGAADDTGVKPLVLNFIITDNCVDLHFENKVESGQEEQLNQKFAEKLSGKASFFNSEGGSGIAKANKILRADLQCEDNKLTLLAEKGLCITDVKIYTENLKSNGQENTCD